MKKTDPRKHILFVDDDRDVLDSLNVSLRREQQRWELRFAQGGEAALRELKTHPIDVIVTDMRMPGMDGATLLRRVRDRHPDVVRIILTGHAETRLALRAIPVSHQWLSKPCERSVLVSAIERGLNLRVLLTDPKVAKVVGGVSSLPSIPSTYLALNEALTDPDVSIEEITRVLEGDAAMSAKVLQITNSSYFALPRAISNIREAVAYLGFRTISKLALSAEVFAMMTKEEIAGFSFRTLQRHVLLTARIAGRLIESSQGKKELADEAYSVGILHDIGQLLLATQARAKFKKAVELSHEQNISLAAAEENLFGTTHAEIGASLLGAWGLPTPIVEGVAYHHVPSRGASDHFGSLLAVHVADVLAHHVMQGEGDAAACYRALDTESLRRAGVATRIPVWTAIAAEECTRLQDYLDEEVA